MIEYTQIEVPSTVEIHLLAGSCMQLDPRTLGHTTLGTDPPYSDHVHERMQSCAQAEEIKGVRHRDAGFDPLDDELRCYIAAAQAPKWSLIYTDIQGNAAWEYALGGYTNDGKRPRHVRTLPVVDDHTGASGVCGNTEGGPVGTLPWVRWSMPQFSGRCPPSGCELLVLAHGPGPMAWRGPGNLIELKHSCLRGDDKHPTEKPLDQAMDLVSWFSNPGDLWYDPTAGFATFGVACLLLGRHYVGFELDAEWHARAAQRIEAARQGWLSNLDANRLMRWRVSIGLPTTGLAIPPEAKTLTKGRIT